MRNRATTGTMAKPMYTGSGKPSRVNLKLGRVALAAMLWAKNCRYTREVTPKAKVLKDRPMMIWLT